MKRKTVFVVDDDLLNRKFLETLLISANYNIRTYSSAKQALADLIETPPDVIISDYMMPEMDGLLFLQEVRKHSENIPIIIISGSDLTETAAEALKLGANDYLPKPIDIKKLLHVVKKCSG